MGSSRGKRTYLVLHEGRNHNQVLFGWDMSHVGAGSREAQVTVGASELPQGGVAYTLQNVLPDFGLNLESTGPGWVWDFADLEVMDSTRVEVQDISEVPFTSQYVFDGPNPITKRIIFTPC